MMKLSSPIAGCMRWGKWGAAFTTYEYRLMIDKCMEYGITSFDHADIYGDYTTEADFGEALKEIAAKRTKMQLITKCGIQMLAANRPHHQIKSYNTGREHILQSVDQSLKNFNTDYIDVLLIHRPDPLLNPLEVAETVRELKKSGKILHFGVSNFLPSQTNILKKHVEIEFNQLEISILNLVPFTNGVLDHCLENNIVVMAWAPLGGGIFNDDAHPQFRAIISVAGILAKKYDTGINQILVAFLLTHPSKIIPVLGTTKVERLLQAKEANNVQLTREDWFKLYTASSGEDVP